MFTTNFNRAEPVEWVNAAYYSLIRQGATPDKANDHIEVELLNESHFWKKNYPDVFRAFKKARLDSDGRKWFDFAERIPVPEIVKVTKPKITSNGSNDRNVLRTTGHTVLGDVNMVYNG